MRMPHMERKNASIREPGRNLAAKRERETISGSSSLLVSEKGRKPDDHHKHKHHFRPFSPLSGRLGPHPAPADVALGLERLHRVIDGRRVVSWAFGGLGEAKGPLRGSRPAIVRSDNNNGGSRQPPRAFGATRGRAHTMRACRTRREEPAARAEWAVHGASWRCHSGRPDRAWPGSAEDHACRTGEPAPDRNGTAQSGRRASSLPETRPSTGSWRSSS